MTPDPITIGNATVEDVLIDWNLGQSSPAGVDVYLDEDIDRAETFLPVGEHKLEECDPEATYWVAEGDGLFERYKDGKVGVPADEKPLSTTTTVTNVDGVTQERVNDTDHTVKLAVNEHRPYSAVSVTTWTGGRYSPNSYTASVGLVADLLERYVNGPLGTDYVSSTVRDREEGRYSWRKLSVGPDREGWLEFDDVEVELVDADIYTWKVLPTAQTSYYNVAGEDDVVYEPGKSVVVHRFESGRLLDVFDELTETERDELTEGYSTDSEFVEVELPEQYHA